MDRRLREIANRFQAFVWQRTRIEMVREDEWENEILTIILTPQDFTNSHLSDYCLRLELAVKDETLNYVIAVKGKKLEISFEKFIAWLRKQQWPSGVGACTRT